MDLVSAHLPQPTPAQLATLMATAQQQALASGLTGLHDFDGPDCLRGIADTARAWRTGAARDQAD